MNSPAHFIKEKLMVYRPSSIGEWCCFGFLQVGWVTHFAARVNLFDGVLMFPAGMLFLHIHTLVTLFGLILLTLRKCGSLHSILLLFFIGFIFRLELLPPQLKRHRQKESYPIMTWNIQGLDTLQIPKHLCDRFSTILVQTRRAESYCFITRSTKIGSQSIGKEI